MTRFDRVDPKAEHARSGSPDKDRRARADEAARSPGPAALQQLQRLVGNRAVVSMLAEQRRQPLGANEEVARRQQLGTEEELEIARQVRSRDVSPSSNPFDYRRDPQPQARRFKSSAGYKQTAVTIDAPEFTATGVSPLYIQKHATGLSIGSGPNPAYTAKGKVNIKGAGAEVGQYEVGFLQTVFESNRHFYYRSATETSGHGAKKMTDYTKAQPGRDGDTGFEPWYGPETVVPFAASADETQSTRMDDTPSSFNDWVKDFGKGDQYLSKTGGRDTFVSWLAIRNKRTKAVTLLNNADWHVNYDADVVVDKGNPANSKVTPIGSLRVTGRGDGRGSKTPVYTDPVANDADWKTTGW
jgi:hypothetical protein